MRIPSGSRRAFLAASAAFAAAPNIASGQTLTKLSVGTSAIDGAMGLYAGYRAGIFRKYGIDLDINLGSGASNSAAVAGGSLQLAGSNIVTLVKAHLKDVPFKLVAFGAIYRSDNPTQVLTVRTDAPFRTAADLNGKTIGVTALGDLLSASTLAWIDQNGGTSSTVKLVELPPSGMAAALVAGRIDAASFAEPYLSTAIRAGTLRVFANIFEAIAPRFLVSGYVGMPEFINANRDLVKRYQRALLEGNAFANAHPDQTAPWLVDLAKVDLATVKGSRREVFAESMDPALVQVEINALVRLKLIDRGFDVHDMIATV